MKHLRLLSLLLLTAFWTPQAKATHLMGGDIVVQQISGLTYGVVMTVYRDTLGIPMQMNATFNVKDSAGTNIMSFQTAYDSVISGNTLPMYPYGVEVYFFIDTITFPSAGMYTIGWSNCCRNGAILNISNPLSQSMFLQTEVTAMDTTNNSTPFFLVPAAIFLPVNTVWQYNPLPFDPDGDSLYWSLSNPLNTWSTGCPGYVSPPGSMPMTINPITGTITWTANTLGNYVTTVLVEEYRDGELIGSIRRDMQFIVVQASGTSPIWNASTLPTDSLGNIHVNLIQNSSFTLNVSGYSPAQNTLWVEAYGEPFFTSPNPAVWTSSGSGVNDSISGTISWAPSSAQTRAEPYLLAIRLSDNFLTQDLSLIFQVSATVDLEEREAIHWMAYPNPSHGQIQLNQPATFVVAIDMLGRSHQLHGQGDRWDVSTLPEGAYILMAKDAVGRTIGTTKLSVQK